MVSMKIIIFLLLIFIKKILNKVLKSLEVETRGVFFCVFFPGFIIVINYYYTFILIDGQFKSRCTEFSGLVMTAFPPLPPSNFFFPLFFFFFTS